MCKISFSQESHRALIHIQNQKTLPYRLTPNKISQTQLQNMIKQWYKWSMWS
jgi:hypothetical protein